MSLVRLRTTFCIRGTLAKDANCAALLDDAKDRGAPVRTRTAAQETASAAGGG